MPLDRISAAIARIKEIEAMVYPQTQTESPPAERFEDVLSEALDDPYDDGVFSDVSIPDSVNERLAFWDDDITTLSDKYGVDPALVRAVMRQESGGNPNAVSSAGAIGLMQLMPGTAKGLGVDPKNPKKNIEGGIKYLSLLADKYDGDVEKTLAAYNAGSSRVDSYGGIPPFPETERYVKNVLSLYRKYSRGD